MNTKSIPSPASSVPAPKSWAAVETDPRVSEAWQDSDGYWVVLKAGFADHAFDLNCHSIHEDLVKDVVRRMAGIQICGCSECTESLKAFLAAPVPAPAEEVAKTEYITSGWVDGKRIVEYHFAPNLEEAGDMIQLAHPSIEDVCVSERGWTDVPPAEPVKVLGGERGHNHCPTDQRVSPETYADFWCSAQGKCDFILPAFSVNLKDGKALVIASEDAAIYVTKEQAEAFFGISHAAHLAKIQRLERELERALRHVPADAMEYSEGTHGDRIYIHDSACAALA